MTHSRTWLASAAAVVCLAAAVTLAFVHFGASPPLPPQRLQFEVHAPDDASLEAFALSPNGRLLAFVTLDGEAPRLFVRSLDTGQSREVSLAHVRMTSRADKGQAGVEPCGFTVHGHPLRRR